MALRSFALTGDWRRRRRRRQVNEITAIFRTPVTHDRRVRRPHVLECGGGVCKWFAGKHQIRSFLIRSNKSAEFVCLALRGRLVVSPAGNDHDDDARCQTRKLTIDLQEKTRRSESETEKLVQRSHVGRQRTREWPRPWEVTRRRSFTRWSPGELNIVTDRGSIDRL